MKSIKLLSIIGLLWLSSGCKKDFLDRTPLDNLTNSNFYLTRDDAIAAVNAVYDPLQALGMYKHAGYRWGAKTDEMFRASDWYNYTYSPSDANTGSNTGWAPPFQGILAANVVFDKIPAMASVDDDLEKRLLGEAAFMRAFYYYFLVRWYGDVPIILDVPNAKTNFIISRDPAAKVYEQIIKDFNLAINNLPAKDKYAATDLGRATQGAAQTMLADVYLYMAAEGFNVAHYTKVKELTNAVITSGKYQLEANFADIFKLSNENGKESVFEVQFQKGSTPSDGSNANTWITRFFSTSVQDAFYNTWDATDKRRSVSVIKKGETQGDWLNTTDNFHQRKAILGKENAAGEAGGSEDSPLNYIVQRYANVLLMYAEAQNELSATPPLDAINYVNQIRARAGLADLPLTITKADFRLAIRSERRYELAFEGHRWFDLVRYERMGLGGGAVDVLGKSSSPYFNANFSWPKHALQPIPQTERDVNPLLTQNPLY